MLVDPNKFEFGEFILQIHYFIENRLTLEINFLKYNLSLSDFRYFNETSKNTLHSKNILIV